MPTNAPAPEVLADRLDKATEDRLDVLENLRRPTRDRWKTDALVVGVALVVTLLIAAGVYWWLRR
jgi:hypothetical protein